MDLARPFADDFDAKQLTLFKTESWSVLVRKVQVTIGCLVLAANRNFISGAELTSEELTEFPIVVGRLEAALSKAFRYDRVNYLCLMMVDRHYHYHVIPRYEKPRKFADTDWVDNSWPKPPNLAAPSTDQATLLKLRDHLLTFLD